MRELVFIDSHTGGEPTRLITAGGPDLGSGSLAERAACLRREHDRFRRAVVEEPRGSEVFVGALLCPPTDPSCAFGVIFFNDVSTLGMCGHGTIGVVSSLAAEGLIKPGRHQVETPVGAVTVELLADGRVAVENVPSWRHATSVAVEVDGVGTIVGDVAWGGNWFFLAPAPESLTLEFRQVPELLAFARAIRAGLQRGGFTGADGAHIDHIELYRPLAAVRGVRGFVLCPGAAWDRSPCGTGTSAKLACLAADGDLEPGEWWRQESVIGSHFDASYHLADTGRVIPTIIGRAFLMARGTLLIDPDDPFGWGIGQGEAPKKERPDAI